MLQAVNVILLNWSGHFVKHGTEKKNIIFDICRQNEVFQLLLSFVANIVSVILGIKRKNEERRVLGDWCSCSQISSLLILLLLLG